MRDTKTTSLGDAFAFIAAEHCGVSPLFAKLILYLTLDDGYGKYFSEVFGDVADNVYTVRYIGTTHPDALTGRSKRCLELAHLFLENRYIPYGEWRTTWRAVVSCVDLTRTLEGLTPGELGERLLQGVPLPTESLELKRELLALLALPGGARVIFSEEDIATSRQQYIGDEQVAGRSRVLRSQAEDFALSQGLITSRNQPFVGVTFGWEDTSTTEWHVLGDLASVNLLRGNLDLLPWFFGAATYNAPLERLPALYATTYLCLVTVLPEHIASPEEYEDFVLINAPIEDMLSCKWIQRLPESLGEYETIKDNLLKGRAYMRSALKN